MSTYNIKSVKIKEQFEGELEAAIVRAMEINDEYQPSYGVQVENESGETLWDSEEIGEDLRSEIVEAVEASGVCCPEVVCDACIEAVKEGKDWQAELAQAKANDAAERKAIGVDDYRFANGSLYRFDPDSNAYVHCFSSPYADTEEDAIRMYEESQARSIN